jgi:CRISPR-associated endonuclease/helicase Cas3
LIEDEDTATVVVLYTQAKDDMGMLLASLDAKGPERWLMRKLQRYTVNIRKRVADKMLEQGSLKTSVVPGLYVQVGASGLYDDKLGLYTEGVPFDALGNVF